MVERKKILIVDDVEELSEYLSIVLGKWGYEVETAASGDLAVSTFAEFMPQLSIVDIGMPVMDGYAVAKTLRDMYSKDSFALIALSGYGAVNDKITSHQSGFDLHLTKPAQLPVLRTIIDNYFEDSASLELLRTEQWEHLKSLPQPDRGSAFKLV